MKKSTNNSLVKRLTIKQMEEIVSKAKLPTFSQERLNSLALKTFDKRFKEQKQWYKRVYRRNIGYQTKEFVWIFELAYKFDKAGNLEFSRILPLHVYYLDKIFTNSYFVMRCGFRAKLNIEWKYVSNKNSYWWWDSLNINYWARKTTPWLNNEYSHKYLSNAHETAYKEGWLHLCKLDTLTSPKWLVEFELLNLLEKKDLNKFLSLDLNLTNISIYRDFLIMNRNRKWIVDKFVSNWRWYHDEWVGIHAREETIKFVKENLPKSTDVIYLHKVKSLEELELLGKKQSNCVGKVYKDYINFYTAKTNTGVELTIRFLKNKVVEARAYNNVGISDKLKLLIERKLNESRKIKTNKSR